MVTQKCLDYIEEKFEDLVDSKKLTNFVIDRVNKFLNELRDSPNKNLEIRINKEIELILYNYKDFILN